jgi:hypothetical protein
VEGMELFERNIKLDFGKFEFFVAVEVVLLEFFHSEL